MAGTMVHLLVAEKLLGKLSEVEWRYCFDGSLQMDRDLFIAGNICPDGIMARKGYRREMKLHTHFRDGIPDGSFDGPGMSELFEKRMAEFWEGHLPDERRYPGLYLGYVTHMMTDERFILEERPKFFKNISAIGLTERDAETFARFGRETDLVDFRLIREFPELSDAYEALKRVRPYEIKGMITEEELTDSRGWILGYFFETDHGEGQAEFLSYDSMVKFIGEVTGEIVERLFSEGILARESKG